MRPIPFNLYWRSTSIVKNSCCQEDALLLNFSVESVEKLRKLRKTAKSGYPALIWPFRTSLFSALSWNKISHMKLQSLKIFKTTKGMFYKQFDFFFANWQVRYWASWTLTFGFNLPSGFRGDAWKCWHTTHTHTYRWQRPTYTLSSPMSLKAQVS